MELADLKEAVPDLPEKSHADKIKLFGWFLHVEKGAAHFSASDIRTCYDSLDLVTPQSFSGYLDNLLKRKEVLKNSAGYRLESRTRDFLNEQFGARSITVQITKLLLDLPARIPDLAEQTYLDEALICFKNGAFRAAVVMTWNLAYHHLCDRISTNHLDEFNARWRAVYPGHHKRSVRLIGGIEDFARELKESEVIDLCNSAGVITKDMHRILVQKLGRRNSAAHPSGVKIGQLQAEEFIDDLINNVVLKLS